MCGCASMPVGFREVDDLKTVNPSIYRVAKDHVLLQAVVKQSCANNLSPFKVLSQVVAGINYKLVYGVSPSCNSEKFNGATKDLNCTVIVYQPLQYTKQEPTLSKFTPIPACQ